MNTEIKLPPLPEPAAHFTVDTGTGYFAGQVEQSHANDKDVVGLYGDLQLQDYARAAVNVYRQKCCEPALNQDWIFDTAPQPAESVRTTSQDEIAAMEAVMQSVDPATWPGLTAAQRCALGRFAKTQNPDNEMIQLGGTAPSVPRWLLNAAQRIEEYMTEHGHGDWAIGGIQKRQFTAHVTKQIRHPDDIEVDTFATAMKAKLAQKREEGVAGWQDCGASYLSAGLRHHVEKGDPVDVANYAMMLYTLGFRISKDGAALPRTQVDHAKVAEWKRKHSIRHPEGSREAAMVVVRHKPDGEPTVWCDPEIADLVDALNNGDLATVASCSGHGQRPGNIMLADGRELIVCKDYTEARSIEAQFL